ncbi:hypothetical protein diail_4299 [Diaporthe ilicicola]|nr:hypothetical protein diail_4299 [Diaporthe ilicicola]
MKPSTAACGKEFKSKNKLKTHIGANHKKEHAALREASREASQEAADNLEILENYLDVPLNANSHINLYVDFREFFEEWSEERFRMVNQETLQKIRQHLHRNGVYTGGDDEDPAHALHRLNCIPCPDKTCWPEPPQWPEALKKITAPTVKKTSSPRSRSPR